MENIGEITLLLLVVALYLTGGLLTTLSIRASHPRLPRLARLCLFTGLSVSVLLYLAHCLGIPSGKGAGWQPLQDNFSALLGLAILLAGFVAYVQATRPMAALEWFVMPIVLVLLLAAGHFGEAAPAVYLPTTYSLVHRATTYLGSVFFAVAAACGAMYLRAASSLRHKTPGPMSHFGSLERLEHLTYRSVTMGFALLSVGCLSGVAWIIHVHGQTKMGAYWFAMPKVVLAVAAWLVYAIVLHTPITPRLRGRRNAVLSIAGFILMLAAIFAVLLMPRKGG